MDTPVPAIDGLDRIHVFVLAALARRPFGLVSIRAVARAAGVSPTAATRALRHLESAGVVERREDRVAEGSAREVATWRTRWDSATWTSMAPAVSVTALPARAARRASPEDERRARRVPVRLQHLLWHHPSGVDPARHGALVASRVLRSEDPEGLAWIADNVSPEDLRRAARSRGLDPDRARLGLLLAGAP